MRDKLYFEDRDCFNRSRNLIEQHHPDVNIENAVEGLHEHRLELQSASLCQDDWRAFVIQNGLHNHSNDFIDLQFKDPFKANDLFPRHRSH